MGQATDVIALNFLQQLCFVFFLNTILITNEQSKAITIFKKKNLFACTYITKSDQVAGDSSSYLFSIPCLSNHD